MWVGVSGRKILPFFFFWVSGWQGGGVGSNTHPPPCGQDISGSLGCAKSEWVGLTIQPPPPLVAAHILGHKGQVRMLGDNSGCMHWLSFQEESVSKPLGKGILSMQEWDRCPSAHKCSFSPPWRST